MAQPRLRRYIIAALTTSLLPIAATTAHAAPNSDGTLSWGIRASFNNYTNGATALKDGAARSSNAFTFPLTDQSYDAQEKRMEAQFAGEVIYKKYCRDNSKPMESYCDLDLSFKNPKVVIDDDGSYIEATVSSRQYQKNEVFAPSTPVKIATLYTSGADFKNTDGTISWSNIPSALTEDGVKMFSNFYNVGEGLDPVNLTYKGEGERPSTDADGLRVSPDTWRSPGTYDDTTMLYSAGSNTIAAVGGHGVYLLDNDLKQVAEVAIPNLNKTGVTAYDAANRVFYYTETDGAEIFAIDVTDSGLSQPRSIGTAPAPVQAIGYNQFNKTAIAIAQQTGWSADKTAHMLVLSKTEITKTTELPNSNKALKEVLNLTAVDGTETVYARGGNFTNEPASLLGMQDGTFVLHSKSQIDVKETDYAAKGILVSLDPNATTAEEAAKIMPGSYVKENIYLTSINTNGTQLYRWNMQDFAANSKGQALEYSNRDVTAGPIQVTNPAGIAALNWNSKGEALALSGVTGDLQTFDITSGQAVDGTRVAIPNGRETSNKQHGAFLVRSDDSMIVPSLDESRGDYKEYYVLTKVYDASAAPIAEPSNDDAIAAAEQRHKARIEAAERAVAAAQATYDAAPADQRAAAKAALEEARKELAAAKGEEYKPLPDDAPTTPVAADDTDKPAADNDDDSDKPAAPKLSFWQRIKNFFTSGHFGGLFGFLGLLTWIWGTHVHFNFFGPSSR